MLQLAFGKTAPPQIMQQPAEILRRVAQPEAADGRIGQAALFFPVAAGLGSLRRVGVELLIKIAGSAAVDFQQTLALMRRCGFMSSFSFCYSDRPGTRASRFLDKIAPDVQQDRLLRLQALQEELGQAWLDARIGRETDVLIEGESRRDGGNDGLRSWQGRDPYGALVHVGLPSADGDMTGRMVRVRLTEAKKHSLLGQQAGASW